MNNVCKCCDRKIVEHAWSDQTQIYLDRCFKMEEKKKTTSIIRFLTWHRVDLSRTAPINGWWPLAPALPSSQDPERAHTCM